MREPFSFGVVVLTMGTRPDELARGLASLQQQRDVTLDVVVVGNSWEPTDIPAEFATLYLPENLGIPAGRNAGVPQISGEFLFFLDDDAWLLDDHFLADCAQIMREDRSVGMIQPRIVDPEADAEDHPGRWVPRLRKGETSTSSDAFSVVEMAVVLRRDVYDASGGWPGPFFYAHEGIELAWRVWNTGHRVVYRGDLRAGHPVIDPRRHSDYFFKNARNRVWLARRNLPWPFNWAYVASWTGVQILRWWRYPRYLKPWFAGWRAGWREDPWAPGESRRRLTWSTIARMSRAGRPPVI